MKKIQQEDTNGQEHFVFRLYITGASPNSSRAVTNLKSIFEMHLHGRYELEIIDVYQQPIAAKKEDIIALPMLVKKRPLPERRMIGDMSNKERVLYSIGVANE